jgi:hypothetical protein
MGILANWKRKRERRRWSANHEKHLQQEYHRAQILEWYKLLKPFHARQTGRYGEGKEEQLKALADDLSKDASILSLFIFFGGVWTVILVLLYLFGDWELRQMALWLAFPGYIGIVTFLCSAMKNAMRRRLENYATGFCITFDPFTGKQIYPTLINCPECLKKYYPASTTDHYLRYFEPCGYCGHNIDWEAAKLPRNAYNGR